MQIILNTTAAQDVILERVRVKLNADFAAAGQPALADVPALITYIITNAVTDYRRQQLAEDLAAVGEVFMNGSNAQRLAIRSAAGLS